MTGFELYGAVYVSVHMCVGFAGVCACVFVLLCLHEHRDIEQDHQQGMISGRQRGGGVITQTCLHSKYVMKSCW